MRDKNNIRKVEQAMRDAFASDKAKVKLSKISEFGLMEVSRQRLQSSIMTGSFTPCSACAGSGRVRSVESSALYLLRRIKETVVRGNYLHVQAKIPVAIANYMLNRKRRELSDIETETGTAVEIIADVHCPPMSAYIELMSQPTKTKRPRRVLQTIDLVRSEVDKRELDEDEQVELELAEERTGWVPPDATRFDLDGENRTLEAEFAHEREILAAQREADESLARQLELAERAKVIEAEALLMRERAREAREAHRV